MPLAHHSLNHGLVAFGFFHIESDMLLLERLFFFAPDFCAMLQWLAGQDYSQDLQTDLPGYVIEYIGDIGDLHGAIAGVALQGFVGALYRRWPFPIRPEDFSQRPAGLAERALVEAAITRFGRPLQIPVRATREMVLSLGEYRFSQAGLRALVDYVWRGGMPGWQGGQRPGYLLKTARVLKESASPWFAGLQWDPRQVGVPPGQGA